MPKIVLKVIFLFLLSSFLFFKSFAVAEDGPESAVDVNNELNKAIDKDSKTAKINIKYSCLKPLFIKDIDKKDIMQDGEKVADLEMWGIKGDCNWRAIYDIEKLKQEETRRLEGKKDSYVPTMEYSSKLNIKFKVKGLQNSRVKQDVKFFVAIVDKQTQEILNKQTHTLKLKSRVKEGKESFVYVEDLEVFYTLSARKVVDLEILLGFESN